MSRYYETIGCLHIHFPLSRGRQALRYLGEEARQAGVDFLVTNSHTPRNSHRKAKTEYLFRETGYRAGTLVIVGEELDDNFRHDSHCLVIGARGWVGRQLPFQKTLQKVKSDGGLIFIAHPDGQHRLFLRRIDHRWKRTEISEYHGLEIWSLLFDWAGATSLWNLPFRYFHFPNRLSGPSSATLRFWEEKARERPLVGVAGLDIHPLLFPGLDLCRKFRYRTVFRILRNHLLLRHPLSGDAENDRKLIQETLAAGRLFVARDGLKDSRGFFFGSEEGKIVMGERACPGVKVEVAVPFSGWLRLYHRGKLFMEKEGSWLRTSLEEPGVYRVEVFYQGQPWIFSNPLYVTGEKW
ncbi:MAG TPA: hypothetical protein PKX93_10640 [bacterium]|nr:hypothetical protein [bacterium]HPP12270.1 hypothetical protein [bacterium]